MFPVGKGKLLFKGGDMPLPRVPLLGVSPLFLPIEVPPTHSVPSVLPDSFITNHHSFLNPFSTQIRTGFSRVGSLRHVNVPC